MLFSSSRGARVVVSSFSVALGSFSVAVGSRIHEAHGGFLDDRNLYAVKCGVDDCKQRIVVVWEEP